MLSRSNEEIVVWHKKPATKLVDTCVFGAKNPAILSFFNTIQKLLLTSFIFAFERHRIALRLLFRVVELEISL